MEHEHVYQYAGLGAIGMYVYQEEICNCGARRHLSLDGRGRHGGIEMRKFSIRLTLDETVEVDALDEDDALDKAWEYIFATGAYGSDIDEVEDVTD